MSAATVSSEGKQKLITGSTYIADFGLPHNKKCITRKLYDFAIVFVNNVHDLLKVSVDRALPKNTSDFCVVFAYSKTAEGEKLSFLRA